MGKYCIEIILSILCSTFFVIGTNLSTHNYDLAAVVVFVIGYMLMNLFAWFKYECD